MSSAPRRSWWRSSSLRWAVLLTGVLWFLTLSVAFGLKDLTERILLAPPTGQAEADEAHFLSALEAPRYAHPELMAPAFSGRRYPLEARDGETFVRYLPRYLDHLRRAQANATAREAAELEARLWLLGEAVELNLGTEPAPAYRALLLAEIPALFHGAVDALIAPRLGAWPDQRSWLELPPRSRARLILSRWLEGETPRRCLLLRSAAGEILEGNAMPGAELPAERAGFRLFRVHDGVAAEPSSEASGLCWSRVLKLKDGAEVLIGARHTDTLEAVLKLRDQLGGGFLLTFILSLLVGGLLGFRIHRRLRAINQVVDEVRAGRLDQRIGCREQGDDFDHLGSNINAMLDHLQQLMVGVREVSDTIAHDLKTPLTRLRHQIDFLARQTQPSTEGVQQVAEEADRLLDTFNALLRIAQLEQGSRRLQPVRFDLTLLVTDVAELYAPVFEEAGMSFTVDHPPEPVWVVGDRPLWLQVLSNLLENTLTHGAAGGWAALRLSAGVQAAPAAAVLEVADRGPGLPEHEFEAVFERFYRADKARSRPGIGLGLSLVRAIADAHEVGISLRNEAGLVIRLEWRRLSD